MDINALLQKAVQRKASDVHLTSDLVPWWRVDGTLTPMENEPVLSLAEFKKIFTQINPKFNPDASEQDFAYEIPDVARFRVNIFKHANGLSAALRVITITIPTLEQLGMSTNISKLCDFDNGLILVTGPTGSGKSTTLAAMINYINEKQKRHIVTIEEPIEYIYQSKNSLIQQREVGAHTNDFQNALRAVLREDPDVILVGEMRDLETIRLALTAAETGHLVFATLHTSSAVGCINRIVDVFNGDEKAVVRAMLAESLQAVIAQTLLPIQGGGRVALQEIMITTPAIRNLIREDKTHQIASAIETGASSGMQSFAQALRAIQQKYKISQE